MPYTVGSQVKLRVQLVDRNQKNDKIIATVSEEGLGMIEWGWCLN